MVVSIGWFQIFIWNMVVSPNIHLYMVVWGSRFGYSKTLPIIFFPWSTGSDLKGMPIRNQVSQLSCLLQGEPVGVNLTPVTHLFSAMSRGPITPWGYTDHSRWISFSHRFPWWNISWCHMTWQKESKKLTWQTNPSQVCKYFLASTYMYFTINIYIIPWDPTFFPLKWKKLTWFRLSPI